MQAKALYEDAIYGFKIFYPDGWIAQEPEPINMGIVVGFLEVYIIIYNALAEKYKEFEDAAKGMINSFEFA